MFKDPYYAEYMPSYTLPSVTPGIWQKFSYERADCFVLDCRSQRDPKIASFQKRIA